MFKYNKDFIEITVYLVYLPSVWSCQFSALNQMSSFIILLQSCPSVVSDTGINFYVIVFQNTAKWFILYWFSHRAHNNSPNETSYFMMSPVLVLAKSFKVKRKKKKTKKAEEKRKRKEYEKGRRFSCWINLRQLK